MVVTQPQQLPHRIKATRQGSHEPSSSSATAAATNNSVDDNNFLQGADIMELTLFEHRPLGCTVEESLGKRFKNVVFCTKVTPGGFADQAGVQPGDVFLGVSGLFGNLEDVSRAGLDRV